MATYRQIQEYVKSKYGFLPKTCWIADVKERAGLSVGPAWNRRGKTRQVPCPPEKVRHIMEALRHFGMIKK
jgi:hypothetical protein